jgi:lysophospholipase L1-like esterase
MLGRAPYGVLENLRREEYNDLLRQTYAGHAPLFDLARLESTDPNGEKTTAAWKGHLVPALAPLYTDDGGHLNALGRQLAAREFVAVLAAIPAR